jgi:HEAT repeat protein
MKPKSKSKPTAGKTKKTTPTVLTPPAASEVPALAAGARQADASEAQSRPRTDLHAAACIEQLRAGELATRMAAASRLGELAGTDALAALQSALRDPTAEVARQAALALGKTNDTSAIGALAAVLENADGYFHSSVRSAAAESLSRFKGRQAIDALTSAVRDPIAEPSRSAIRGLGLVAGSEALPTLLMVVSNSENYFLPSVRLTAVQVLSSISDPTAAECLRRVRENPLEDPSVREAAQPKSR